MRGHAAQMREAVQQSRQLIRAGRALLRREGVPDVEEKAKIVLRGFQQRQQARIVQAEMLKIGMDLEPPDAPGLEAFQFPFPCRECRMDGPEGRHLRRMPLQGQGEVVDRHHLPGRSRGAENHAALHPCGALPFQQVFERALSGAVNPVTRPQRGDGVPGRTRRENMGVAVRTHGRNPAAVSEAGQSRTGLHTSSRDRRRPSP